MNEINASNKMKWISEQNKFTRISKLQLKQSFYTKIDI